MSIASDSGEFPVPARRWFVIVLDGSPEQVIDRFEAPGWAPAILAFADKLREGTFTGRAWLREARDSET